MTDYEQIAKNLEAAKEVVIRLNDAENSLALINDILVMEPEGISFFQHNILIRIGNVNIDSVSNKNALILEAIREKLEDDVSLYKGILSDLNVNIDDQTS